MSSEALQYNSPDRECRTILQVFGCHAEPPPDADETAVATLIFLTTLSEVRFFERGQLRVSGVFVLVANFIVVVDISARGDETIAERIGDVVLDFTPKSFGQELGRARA